MQFVRNLTFPGDFIPSGSCYWWNPSLIRLDAASDSLIALSFLPIRVARVSQFREMLFTLAVYWLRMDQPPLRRSMTYRVEKGA